MINLAEVRRLSRHVEYRERGDRHQPDPAVPEFLQQVATQIGLAIAHVRAYEEINRLRDQPAQAERVFVGRAQVAQHHDMVAQSGFWSCGGFAR
ncbi:MAG: hypothetical protein U0361_20580 [Nitrospiraceae bacterium]